MATERVVVDLLARHPELIEPVGVMRWHEWAYGDPSPAAFIETTRREAGQECLPITLVAIGASGEALGAVGLDHVDGELSASERDGRTPWLVGMVVTEGVRRQGIGRLLVDRLEQSAAEYGHNRVWVATGDQAVDFYRRCGWVPAQRLRLSSTGIDTTILRSAPSVRSGALSGAF